MSVSAEAFRAAFPALRSRVWFDTPASPPLADPVRHRLSDVLADWSAGTFDLPHWEGAAPRVRISFARWLGIDQDRVAVIGSVAEGVASVARGLPPGRVVVGANEYRSNLLVWLMLDPERNEVVRVPARAGGLQSEDLAAAVNDDTVLLAVSEVLASDGIRQNIPMLRAATTAVGARLLVDATQSLGVLAPTLDADHVIAHGYKWLLCPRGAAFLVSRRERLPELLPAMPSWKTRREEGYYGGELNLALDASRCDTTPAWLSWLGAEASIELLASVSGPEVEAHCVGLSSAAGDGARELGYEIISPAGATGSHILAVSVPDPDQMRTSFDQHAIHAAVYPDHFRAGFHYFNDDSDVAVLLAALRDARR